MSDTRPSIQPIVCTACGEDASTVRTITFRKETVMVRDPDGGYSQANCGPWNPDIVLHPECVPAYVDALLIDTAAWTEPACMEDDDDDGEEWKQGVAE